MNVAGIGEQMYNHGRCSDDRRPNLRYELSWLGPFCVYIVMESSSDFEDQGGLG